MKTKALLAFLLLAAPAARAMDIRPALWGGYSQLSMAKVNDGLKQMKSDIEGSGATVNSQTLLGPAWMVGLDVDFLVLPWLALGPRLAYIQGLDAVTEASNGPAKMKATYRGHAMPLMLGAKVLSPEMGAATFWGGAYLGQAFATVGNRAEMTLGSTVTGDVSYSGSALCAELEAGVRYKLAPQWSAQAQLGWRFANVPEVTADNDETNIYSVKKGDKALDSNNQPLPMDFSGFNLSLGVALAF